VKVVAAYLSPTWPPIDSHFTACLSGDLPVLKAVGINTKYRHWNSRVITSRGALLLYYVDSNACQLYGPYTPTTASYQQITNADVLDIVVMKNIVLLVFLTALHSARITYLS
jgi:hypothetical protein